MHKLLSVLLVEDSAADAELLLHELTSGGYDVTSVRVETAEDMRTALELGTWDLVLSDYSLPTFSAPAALAVLHDTTIDIPFLIVSGTIGEETAVAALKAGASDFLVKGRLARLVPAIERELREASTRRARRVLEEQLRESQARSAYALDAAGAGVWEFDLATNATRWTERISVMLGLPPTPIETDLDGFREHVHPEDVPRLNAALARAIDAGAPYHVEFRAATADPTPRWISSTGQVIRNANGTPTGMMGISLDVTHDKRAERHLRESEERFRLITETISEVFWIADADFQQLVYVSPAYEQIWGRALDSDEPQSLYAAIHPEDRARIRDAVNSRTRGPFEREYRIVRPDGQIRWIWERGFPVRAADGSVRQYVGAAQDVTQRVEAEHARHAAKQRMRFALEASRVGIWETDLTTDASYWSDVCEVLHGLPPGTFGGTFQAFLDCLHPHDRDDVRETIHRAINEHQEVELEYRTVWPDGTVRHIRSTARFYTDATGRPVRGAGIAMDVTDRRSLEEQLRQTQKLEAIGQLAGGIAHDFNNLLTAILGYCELLTDQIDADKPLGRDLREIKAAGERAAALTRQLLAFSRKQVLTVTPLDLNDIVRAIHQMLSRLIGERIQIRIELAETLPAIMADASQIEQVIVNLAVNARDAMPNGGELSVRTAHLEPDGSYHTPSVLLTVTDTGTGMTPAVSSRIFEPFFTTKERGRGTGLGLAAVHGIVTQLNGSIEVESALGRGSTFKIRLPATMTPVTRARNPAREGLHVGAETILLVEDEQGVRAFVRAALQRVGHRVLEAASAEEALKLGQHEPGPIDLLLTDVVLPHMDGCELAERLALTRPGIRVLFMSGYNDSMSTAAGHVEPGAQFIAKPFSPRDLLMKIRQQLEADEPASRR
jgi:PAS domain S-box-containing protein